MGQVVVSPPSVTWYSIVPVSISVKLTKDEPLKSPAAVLVPFQMIDDSVDSVQLGVVTLAMLESALSQESVEL